MSEFEWDMNVFQYIPCYGLSIGIPINPAFSVKFQYIPCYGLSSHLPWSDQSVPISIHPMLRFISTGCTSNLSRTYFNTSHVTVYPHQHPHRKMKRTYFNTSHVTVYLIYIIGFNQRKCISIHPMLRFIPVNTIENPTNDYFNTSHVTVYPEFLRLHPMFLRHFNTSHVTVYQPA